MKNFFRNIKTIAFVAVIGLSFTALSLTGCDNGTGGGDDDEGKEVLESVWAYNADGALSSKTEYEYDPHGNRTKLSRYGADGALSSKYEYEYDSHGNQTKESYYGADGTLSYKIEA
jgi:hypothetical protein